MMPAVLIGLVNGIGVGVFRVHPLIMTLGTSLIGIGCLQVYQRTVIASGTKIPDFLAWLGTGLTFGFPNALLLFVPLAVLSSSRCAAPASAACSTRSATTSVRRGCPACATGR